MRNSLGHGKAFSFQAILLYLATAVSLSACNPQGDISTIEAGFHPGLVSAQHNTFSNVWDFNTNASYAYDSSKIQFTGGVCSLKGTDQIDDDNSASGFGGGSLSGAAWDGVNGVLRIGTSGGCDGTTTACANQTVPTVYELNSSWTPHWADLVSYYKMDGDVSDSRGSNNGTISGSVTFPTTAKIGSHSLGLVPPENVTLNHGSLTSTTWTVCAWVNPADVSVTNFFYLESGPGSDAWLYINAGGTAGLLVGDGSGQTGGTTIMAANHWYYLCGVRNGSQVNSYVDGRLEGTASYSGAAMSPTIAIIANPPFYFRGQMDELSIWSTGLNSSDIQTIYNRQSVKYSGTITSRVMDALQTGMSWTTLGWKTTVPFLKELPDYANGAIQNESSTDYASLVGSTGTVGDNNLMSGIIGLWHLDEEAVGSGGSTKDFKDASGGNNWGTAYGATSLGQPGRLGNAPVFDGSSGYVTTATAIITPPNVYTISAWFKTTATGGQVVGFGDQRTSLSSAYDRQIYITNSGTVVFKFVPSGVLSIQTLNPYNDGSWHHAVATAAPVDGTHFYVDGILIGSDTQYGGQNFPGYWRIGYDNLDYSPSKPTSRYFKGAIDEVAIWNRALDPKEILQLYRRGANRVKHQVRVCTASDCSDDATGANWKGPDGTNQTYFSELNNNTVPLAMSGAVKATPPSMLFSAFTNPVGTSRYFQYRTILESDDTGTGCNYGSGATWCSPELKSVTVDPVHYDSSSPTVVGHTGVSFYSLANFTQTLGSSCAGGIGYNLGVGSSYSSAVWYWWDSSANSGTGGWAAADGTVAKSNDAATINSHASTFGTQASTGTVYFKAFLKSSGSTACELDQLDLGGQQ